MYAYVPKEAIDLTYFPKNPVVRVRDMGSDFVILESESSKEKFKIRRDILIIQPTKLDLLKERLKYETKKKEVLERDDVQFIKQIISSYYPEQDFDVIPFPIKECVYFIIVLRELVVKNKEGLEHLTGDVYVCLTYDYSVNMFTLRADKEMFSLVDFEKGYVQSHIRRKMFEDNIFDKPTVRFPSFCTGSGTFAQDVLTKVFSVNHEASRLRIESFISYLRELFEYESIEGGPYVKIETLSDNDDSIVYLFDNNEFERYMRTNMKFKECFEESIILKLIGENIEIDFEKSYKKFEKLIKEAVEDDFELMIAKPGMLQKRFFVMRNIRTGKMISLEQWNSLPESKKDLIIEDDEPFKILEVSSRPQFYFKNRLVHIKKINRKYDISKIESETKENYVEEIHISAKTVYKNICKKLFLSNGLLRKIYDRCSCDIREERFTYYTTRISGPV